MSRALSTTMAPPFARRPFILRHLAAIACRVHQEDGAAAVPFLLALPLFLMVVSVIAQFALLVTADAMVKASAEAAARSAVVTLPQGNTDAIRRAALMVLAPASPQANTVDPEAQEITDAFNQSGMTISNTYASRYTYAMQGTTVTWDHQNDAQNYFISRPGTTVVVTVSYQFQLTIPFAARVLATATTAPIAGVTGRFSQRTQTVTVFTTPSRQTAATVNGPTLGP